MATTHMISLHEIQSRLLVNCSSSPDGSDLWRQQRQQQRSLRKSNEELFGAHQDVGLASRVSGGRVRSFSDTCVSFGRALPKNLRAANGLGGVSQHCPWTSRSNCIMNSGTCGGASRSCFGASVWTVEQAPRSARRLATRVASCGAENESVGTDDGPGLGMCCPEVNPETSSNEDRQGFLESDYRRLWVTVLGRMILPVAVLGLGVLLRTRPAFALGRVMELATTCPGSRKQILMSAWTGLAAGCLHTLTGPDHLTALAPLCIGRSRVESAQVGALWGCGHDAGQMIFGILFLILKDKLHLDLIRTWASRVVGLTLITIGGMGVMEAQEISNLAFEGEGGCAGHDGISNGVMVKRSRSLATFATGVVHGLQPDALLMILPALALPSRLAGAAFLGMFLSGTVIAMGSYTWFLASCTEAWQKKVPGITKRLTLGSALVAMALGSAFILGEFLGVSIFGG